MLYIVFPELDYVDYILSPLKEDRGVKLLKYREREVHGFQKVKQKTLRYLEAMLPFRTRIASAMIFDEDFRKALREIGKEDRLLIFTIKNFKTQVFIKNETCLKEADVYLFDSIRTFRHNLVTLLPYHFKTRLRKLVYHTFDPSDARRFRFRQVRPVFNMTFPKNGCNAVRDIFFIGYIKNRGEELMEVIKRFEAEGLDLDFRILKTKHDKRNEIPERYRLEKRLPYSEVFAATCASRALLEIIQDKQEGSTLRALEAVSLGKKLITNNKRIKEEPFYRPENIYILGEDEGSVKEFLTMPGVPVEEKTRSAYDIRRWIEQFKK